MERFPSFIRKFFSPASGRTVSGKELLPVYVRCGKCGEELRILINLQTDLERTYGEDAGGSAYTLRKEAMDGTCFTMISLKLEFDINKNIISKDITNGAFIDGEGK